MNAKAARMYGWHTTEIILATLEWIVATGSTSIRDVDDAIAALPAASAEQGC